MAFDDLYLVSDRTATATPDEFASAESAMGMKLPADYVAFVSRFGQGAISNWVRVYGPRRIAGERDERREGLEQYYFWDEGADVLSREQVNEAIMLADTFNGDEVIYRESAPSGFFVLPRDEEGIYAVGETLEQAVDWLCKSGTLTGALPFLYFEPFGERRERRYASNDGVPFETVRDALVALGLHDADVDMTEGDDKCHYFFYREFGGLVVLVEGEDGAVALLSSDPEPSGAKIDRVAQTLQETGLSET